MGNLRMGERKGGAELIFLRAGKRKKGRMESGEKTSCMSRDAEITEFHCRVEITIINFKMTMLKL